MTFTYDELLDLDITSRRRETFRFDVLDQGNALIGTLAAAQDPVPSVTNNVDTDSPRKLSGLLVPQRTSLTADSPFLYAGEFNTLTDRVRVIHVVDPGGAAYEAPLGTFLWAEAVDQVNPDGTPIDGQLVDQSLLLMQPLDESVNYDAGSYVHDALAEQAAAAGIMDTFIETTQSYLSAPITGAIGRDTRGAVMRALCAAGGYLPWYFDNDGALVVRVVPNLDVAVADHVYALGDGTTGRIISDTIRSSNGLLVAPNRYIAYEGSGTTGAPLVGIFDVADSAPHSYANIGRRVTRAESVQGLLDQDAADQAAAALYAQDESVYSTVSFSTPIDSRHDSFDIIEYEGVNYLEQVWRIPCAAGGAMTHELRRLY